MILPLILLAAAPPVRSVQGPPAPRVASERARFDACVARGATDPDAAARAADDWIAEGGSVVARQCLGLIRAHQQDWRAAGQAFDAAAAAAVTAQDERAATLFAQAGNAWLAAGDAPHARTALDAALASPQLNGLQRGEAELDRARAAEASGDRTEARAAIDRALPLAGDDPLAWLLSATLARRAGDLPRAKADIGEALRRSADDVSVQLEAGNIAAAAGDASGAKAAWNEAKRLRPGSPQALAAGAALAQFE